MSTPSDMIVGIDLGTTFSLVGYADERGLHVIRDENGDARLPSVIGVQPDEAGRPQVTIGWAARNHAVENPAATVYSIKRLIGKSPTEIAAELPFLTYAVKPGARGNLEVEIAGRRYSPEQISSVILRALKDRAERHLGCEVRRAVVTVPAYFDDAQRQATRDAGEAAGLEIVRIINEPTAAALAYGIGTRAPAAKAARQGATTALPQPSCHDAPGAAPTAAGPAQTVAIYDLGGGTFDVSILRLDGDVFEVLSTAGDTHLGGDDFDRAIIQLVNREVRAEFGLEIEAPATRQALRGLAEAVKVRLSMAPVASLELDLGDGRVYRRQLSVEEFERAIGADVERSIRLCERAIADAGLKAGDVDQIILVGGSTRIPLVRRRVEEQFGKPPYTALNPDEVVALGAAAQAAQLAGRRRDLLLLDVIPLALGIETLGGAMGKLIVRNTTIPCRATEMFTTFVDGQTAIKFTVLQGERELAAHCRALAEFELRGIPPMPAGMPKIEVEFLVDANGILNVAAVEQRSGAQAAIQVVPNFGLTRAEVARMTTESIQFAAEDISAHRRIDLLNQVEFDTKKCEQVLARLGDQLPARERARYDAAIAELRSFARETADLNALHQALMEFGRSTLPLAERGITNALIEAQRETKDAARGRAAGR